MFSTEDTSLNNFYYYYTHRTHTKIEAVGGGGRANLAAAELAHEELAPPEIEILSPKVSFQNKKKDLNNG